MIIGVTHGNVANKVHILNVALSKLARKEVDEVFKACLGVIKNDVYFEVFQKQGANVQGHFQQIFELNTRDRWAQGVLDLLSSPDSKYVNPAAHNNKAIFEAAKYGNIEMVKALKTDPRVDPNVGFIAACAHDQLKVAQLLYKDIRVDPFKTNVLGVAIDNGYADIVKFLLPDPRAQPEGEDFINAVLKNHVEVVKLLLDDKRASPTAQGHNALLSACSKGFVEIVKLLIVDERVDPSFNRNTPLRFALEDDQFAVADVLLRSPRFKVESYTELDEQLSLGEPLFLVLFDKQQYALFKLVYRMMTKTERAEVQAVDRCKRYMLEQQRLKDGKPLPVYKHETRTVAKRKKTDAKKSSSAAQRVLGGEETDIGRLLAKMVG